MPPAIAKGKAKAIERTPLLDDTGNPTAENGPEGQFTDGSLPAAAPGQPVQQAWRSHLLTAALILLSICFAALLAIVLLAESYAAPAWRNIDQALSQPGGDRFWKEAVPIRGPDAVNVVGVDSVQDEKGASQLQVNVSVALRMTVDTDFVMGFRKEDEQHDGWWTKRWKEIGRWAVRRLGSTTATLDDIVIYPSNSEASAPLLTVTPLSPILISLSPGLSTQALSSLKPVSIDFLAVPSQNASYLLEFMKDSWAQAFVSVRVHGSDLQVHGGYQHSKPPRWWQLGRWRNWLKLKKPEVALKLRLPITPLHIPSQPPTKPGSNLPSLSKLLRLESFVLTSAPSPVFPQPAPSSTPQSSPSTVRLDRRDIEPPPNQKVLTDVVTSPLTDHFQSLSTSDSWNIIITARASLAHPFADSIGSKLDFDVPPFPFTISLPVPHSGDDSFVVTNTPTGAQLPPDLIPVSQVYASPSVNKTHVIIDLSGYVLPLSKSSSGLADAISIFVTSYLSYKASAIAVSTSLYPSLVVKASFPPPATRLELIKNVTIENMSIRPGFGTVSLPDTDTASTNMLEILATATVHARVVLPPGVDIDINVGRLWIDLLVFDGEVPSEDAKQATEKPFSAADDPPVPKPRPLPDPLPERAFARITPRNWLNASSSRSPPDVDGAGNGTNVYVTAEIVDVPLEVLPGRGSELSRFVTKVLFSSDPVVAGISGVAAVGVGVPGLTNPVPKGGPKMKGGELILTGIPFEGNVPVGGEK